LDWFRDDYFSGSRKHVMLTVARVGKITVRGNGGEESAELEAFATCWKKNYNLIRAVSLWRRVRCTALFGDASKKIKDTGGR